MVNFLFLQVYLIFVCNEDSKEMITMIHIIASIHVTSTSKLNTINLTTIASCV